MNGENNKLNTERWEFTTKKQIGYGFGDFGYCFSWTFISSFLMYFWTDVLGVAAGFAGTIMLLSRFWDAVNDPMVGHWADHTKHKDGRYRPWLKWACLPLMIMTVLCFTAFPLPSVTAKNIYALVTFFIAVFVSTMYYIPSYSLVSTCTLDSHERSRASSFRMIFAYLSGVVVVSCTKPLVALLGGGNDAKGYVIVGVIYAIICGIGIMVMYHSTREVIHVEIEESASFKESIKCLKKNRYTIILALGFIAYGLENYGRGAAAVYYFTYVAENSLAFSIYAILHYGVCAIGAYAMPFIERNMKNKGSVAKVGFLVAGAMMILQALIDPAQNIILFFGTQLFVSFFAGMAATMLYGMIPDVVDYTQYLHGTRNSGFIAAVANFFLKVGMAIGTSSIGWILAAVGYVPNVAQTATVNLAIRGVYCVLPGVFCIVAFIAMSFYKLDKKSHKKILDELAVRDGLASI